MLLVLGCAHPGCGSDARSWRAFRCQRVASPAEATEEGSVQHIVPASASGSVGSGPPEPAPVIDQDQGPSAHHEPVSSDPFGGGFDCEDGGFSALAGAFETGDDAGSAALDFSDLGAVLEDCAARQLQQPPQPAGAPRNAQCSKGGAASGGKGGAASAAAVAAAGSAAEAVGGGPSLRLTLGGPPLPEFHILGMQEPTGQHVSFPGGRGCCIPYGTVRYDMLPRGSPGPPPAGWGSALPLRAMEMAGLPRTHNTVDPASGPPAASPGQPRGM